MVKGHLDLKAMNVSKTVWESVSHPRSEMCQGPLSKFNSTIKLLSGMLPVLSQVTRAGVPTLTLTLGLLSRDRPGFSFRLNLGEAEGDEAVSFLIFCSVGMVLISSHQLHTNTGCFPEKGRAKWRGLWNVLDAMSACYITGCLSSIREGIQLSKDALRFQHSSVSHVLPLGCILWKTSGHLPRLAGPQLLHLCFPMWAPTKGKK